MSDLHSHPLLSMVRERGLLDDLQFEEVTQEAQRSGKPVAEILADFGLLDQDSQLQIIAEHLGTEVVDLASVTPDPETLKAVPAATAKNYQCFPYALHGTTLQLALGDPLNPTILDELGFSISYEIVPVVADPKSVSQAIDKHYGGGAAGGVDGSDTMAQILKELGADAEIEKEAAEAAAGAGDLNDLANEVPIVKFVNLVLAQAIQDRASDIHFEPFETEFKIRYRVDGALYEMAPPPKHLSLPVTSRLKVMANLDISERRLPQDGRISMTLMGRQIDLRISTLPTQFGESVVLRVLDREATKLDLEVLGLPKDVFDFMDEVVQQPNGIVIVTGPTGSGKTTTLYSCLRRINTIDAKLLTAEDPVEYDIEGIMQVAINEAVGMTFGKALRSFLRQDPDVIMVGEIRDAETADTAINAALTGHLVFSTLHTNTAAGVIPRLIGMQVNPKILGSSLTLSLAQRLLRKICNGCKVEYEATDDEKKLIDRVVAEFKTSEAKAKFLDEFKKDGQENFYKLHKGLGCKECNGFGYKGRLAVHEGIYMSKEIEELAANNPSEREIQEIAGKQGFLTLREDTMLKILRGITTVEEAMKIVDMYGAEIDRQPELENKNFK